MALQVWLPLNGNLNNQGVGNYTASSSSITYDNNGKIGKCYYFAATNATCITTDFPTNIGTGNFTIACWVKIPTISSGTYYAVCSSKNTAAVSTGFGIYWNYTQKKFLWSTGDGTNATEIWMADAVDTLVYDKWIHLVMVRDSSDAKKGCFYINGTRYELASVPAIRDIGTVSYMSLGKCNSNSYYLKMYMNDFRIYDHALSPKEIEILSRGLVAHYPLDNNGSGQPNLYDFESVASKWAVEGLTLANATDDVYGNILKITSPSSVSSQRIYRNVSNVWKADQKFTVSFLAKASKTVVVKMSRSLANYAPDVTVGTEWKRYSTVITCSTTADGETLSVQTSTASADIYLTQVKLELGDKATAYQPGVGDSHYTPLGYGDTTEYDVSGYQYNGTKNGTLAYTSDTARYSVCTSFNGTDNSIRVPLDTFFPNATTFTINLWFKKSELGSKGYETLIGGVSGFEMDTRSGTSETLSLYMASTRGGSMYSPFDFNKWYMVTMVCDGTNELYYVNGVLARTITKKGMPSGGYWIGAWNASTVQNYKGLMSDVRIYATALSASQVAELYNTAVSVANNGTLMGYELVEG